MKEEWDMMREELKKIWKPGRILLLLLLGYLFYMLFLEFYINYYFTDPVSEGMLIVSEELIDRYGTSLSEEEMAEVKESWPSLLEEADMCVKGFELAKKYGLDSYEEYREFYTNTVENVGETSADLDEAYADAMRIENYLKSEETGNIFGRIRAMGILLDSYESAQTFAADPSLLAGTFMYVDCTKKELSHIADTLFGEEALWQNILPWVAPESFMLYMTFLCVWMCLSVCLLLSPLLVTDRMSRMWSLQYSSKRGRGVYRTQFGAAMLSAFLLATVNLSLFLGIFQTTGVGIFWESRMYSFIEMLAIRVNWTYGTWCVVLVVLSYLVTLGVAALAFVLSRSCANYIVMLLKMIPLFLAAAIFCLFLFRFAFCYNNFLYSGVVPVPFVEVWSTVLVLLVGMMCFGLSWRRLRVADC